MKASGRVSVRVGYWVRVFGYQITRPDPDLIKVFLGDYMDWLSKTKHKPLQDNPKAFMIST